MTENNVAQTIELASRAREWAMQRGSVENFPATARAHIRGLADALLSKLRADGVQINRDDADLIAAYAVGAKAPAMKEAGRRVQDTLESLPPLVGCSPGDFVSSAQVVTVDEAREYARAALASAPVAAQDAALWVQALPGHNERVSAKRHQDRQNGYVIPLFTLAQVSGPVDAEADEGDFLVRLFAELDTWRAEDWNELIERRPAILALLRPLVMAGAKVAAWMTDDGRVATDETKRTAMASASRLNFNIPLVRADQANAPVDGLPDRDTTKPAEVQGLFRKFDVRRTDGSDAPGGKHHGCRYFVLDVDHDRYAPATLGAYAALCEADHPGLARDLREKWGALVAGEAQPAASTEHYDEVKATLQGAHRIMESLSAIERRVGPIGSHARGYTHKITAALHHLDALYAAPQASEAVCSCPTGDGSLRHPCAVHPPGDKDGGDCAKGAGDLLAPVFQFLLGEGPLRGVHFGDRHPDERGAYWWRKDLRAALSPTQPTEQGERDE